VPTGVEVEITPEAVRIKGPKGRLEQKMSRLVMLTREGQELLVKTNEASTAARAMSGTTRALVQNMVTGVVKGFEKRLTIIGVGYRAAVQGRKLNLTLGFSHPVAYMIPEGITIETPSQTEIVVKGVDRQMVGQVAADIRSYRPPEPYKGKGIRYSDERIVMKEAKKK